MRRFLSVVTLSLALTFSARALAIEPPRVDQPAQVSARLKKDGAVVLSFLGASSTEPDNSPVYASFFQARGMASERVEVVRGASASKQLEALEETAARVKGTLWVVMTGVGWSEDGARYLGASAGDADRLALAQVVDLLGSVRAKRVFLIVDAGFPALPKVAGAATPGVTLKPWPTSKKVVVWAATTGSEPAALYPAAGRSLFGYFSLGALQGWADGEFGSADGTVTLEEAQTFVARLVKQVGGGAQRPTSEPRVTATSTPLFSGGFAVAPKANDYVELARAARAARIKSAEDAVKNEAASAWLALQPTLPAKPTPQATKDLEAYVAKWDAASIVVDATTLGVAVPEVGEARAKLDAWARLAQKGKRKRGQKRTRGAAAAPPAPPSACQDLVKLEPRAITGELTEVERACVEGRIAAEKKQTTRDKLSRVLLIDADARGDTARWKDLAARHLDSIDRSDPDLCFRYALVLSRGSLDDAEDVVRWVDVALENKHDWEGPKYMARVYGLLQLKAEMSARLWAEAEADFLDERSDANSAEAELARGGAKTAAREWLDQARATDQSTDRARVLCEAAAGTSEACPR